MNRDERDAFLQRIAYIYGQNTSDNVANRYQKGPFARHKLIKALDEILEKDRRASVKEHSTPEALARRTSSP